MRNLAKVAVLLSFSSILPGSLRGQDASEPCSYDACALRVEPRGFFSETTVVRGTEGTVVATQDRNGDLERLFQASDSAAVHYASFAVSDRHADWLSGLSGGLALASLVVVASEGDWDEWNGWPLGLDIGAFVVGIAAVFPRRNADRAFSRAVWWYNRDLATGEREEAAAPTPAWFPTDPRWMPVEYGDGYPRSAMVFVDTTSVARESEDRVQAWVFTGWAGASRVPTPLAQGAEGTFDNTRQRTELDCRSRRYRSLRLDGYLGTAQVFSSEREGEWFDVLATSVPDVLLPVLCGGLDGR